jgi:hypothetical protein
MSGDPPGGAAEPENDGRLMNRMVPGSFALPYTLLMMPHQPLFSSPRRLTWIFVMEFDSGIDEMRN